jgi:DNA-binding transcriptional LysR family regulator
MMTILDIGLIPAPCALPGFATELLLETEFQVALPAGHPLARRKSVALSEAPPVSGSSGGPQRSSASF